MDITKIPVGKNPPEEINVIIEVPAGSAPVKYEFDKDAGALVVDRIVHTAMHYPCNYGFVPGTLGDDGDPLDVLVVSTLPFISGCYVPCRPIGVLNMEDESGRDEKIIAVPTSKTHPFYDNVNEIADLPEVLSAQIAHFFEHYKDLEKGKWVKVTGYGGAEDAKKIISASVK